METVILMGPVGAGKSTQAKLLSEELGQPRCSYDEVKADYLEEVGFDKKTALAINDEQGEYAMFCHMNKFRYQVLEKIIKEHPGHIIDLGGGIHCYNEALPSRCYKTTIRSNKRSFLFITVEGFSYKYQCFARF